MIFDNLIDLNNEIELLQTEIELVTAQAETITSQLTGMPHGSSEIKDRMAESASKLADLQTLLSKIKDKRLSEKINVIDIISKEQDSTLRRILYLRYVKGYTQEKIGEEVGYTQVAIFKILTRYIKTH